MWEYVKGSEADFEGAPEWATLKVESWWLEDKIPGSKWVSVHGGNINHISNNGLYAGYPIKAERRKVDSLQSRVNDANLQQAFQHDKYNRPCKGVTIDVYDVLSAFNVTNPALQHLIKKALAVGQRGHKDKTEDLNDILASAKRAIELEKQQ